MSALPVTASTKLSITEPKTDSEEDLVMDDCAAAMVLMSLSCSPKSPFNLFNRLSDPNAGPKYSTSWMSNGESSVDSGVVVEVGSPPQSYVRHPLHPKVRVITSPSSIRFEEVIAGLHRDMTQSNTGLSGSGTGSNKRKRIIFACTWPGCDAKYRQNSAIERHVRTVHLGPSVEENEEEFYYTEIEVEEMELERFRFKRLDSPSVTESEVSEGSSSGLSPVSSPGPYSFSPSAPTWSHLDMARPPHEDPEYQNQLKRQRLSSPINIPGVSYAHITSVPTSQRNNNHHHHKTMGKSLLATPKGRGRTRGETRKCRKVYGMEARDSWCTQCKWKKACTRFTD